ncbi:DUF192 domain-containing protein [Halocalculus aciditolerans]|uniref:DUF192 domain-containing protein n=1 Tax=Halocalculus aciditolerans TaxID=1383812 RepID=A0A830F6Y0_9EURY|nr:DUF192 domain-containing protein [Halocalculus aciditolerans]GGL69232.1 hypothetical protein GCM10009039_28990 [Halocalculus aciditolerans]
MRSRSGVVAVVVGCALVAVGVWWVGGGFGGDAENATVTVSDANGTTLGVVSARVADTPQERYRGLSNTASLENGSGMWFVFEEEASRAFVMRDVNYPLDIVFVGADGRITVIHHAATEEPPYEKYRGRAKWVLEVPRGWASARGVDAGDRVTAIYGPR